MGNSEAAVNFITGVIDFGTFSSNPKKSQTEIKELLN
jgi:hypothetical protein